MAGKRARRERRRSGPSIRIGTILRTLFSVAMLYRKAMRARRKAGGLLANKSAEDAGKQGRGGRRKVPARSLGAVSTGSVATGALAIGAFAVGALAIRALAIRRLAIKRASIGELDVHDLRVGRLEVDELLVRRETHSQPPTPVENP